MKNLVTIGTFDGIHLGHQALIRKAVRRARRDGMRSLVIVFNRPPRLFFNPRLHIPLITTAAERAALLGELGVDKVITLDFDARLAAMSAERFFTDFLLKKNKMGCLVVGSDFALGKDRAGTTEALQELCRRHSVAFEACRILLRRRAKVSSRRIRGLLSEGKIRQAERLLGYRYFLCGKVVRGRRLGRTLGFPTANLEVPDGKILPPGVFHASARTGGRRYPAALNVGHRPTAASPGRVLKAPAPLAEAHLIGFKGRLAGKTLRVELIRRLRAEKKFNSLQALARQIRADVERIRRAARPARRAVGPGFFRY
ncbi:MAG: riboflavin biosynthesis protein RibF [Elusimicrobia bacterium]|nr:riboflavin biosynthesis protein RibF [Elusimicrobiota bacterium]